MADILGLTASAASGGLFGLLGTVLGRISGYVERRQALHHERAKWGHEVELLKLQQAAARQETEAELSLEETRGSWRGLEASMRADAEMATSYRWVSAVRGLTRPALTLILWLIAALIWFGADADGRSSIIETATFAATAATLWWFGDRGPRPRSKL